MTPVRFTVYEEYDANIDAGVTVFTATTPIGSYFARMVTDTASKYREKRDLFKQCVVDCINKKIEPGEVELDA
mgnify:CR=1 FL=1